MSPYFTETPDSMEKFKNVLDWVRFLAAYCSKRGMDPADPCQELSQEPLEPLIEYGAGVDVALDPTKKLPFLPTEIVAEIMSNLDLKDLNNTRLVNKRFRLAGKQVFGKALVDDRSLYPTYSSIASFFDLLRLHPSHPYLVRTINLVSEHAMRNSLGYEYAWERLQDQERVSATEMDAVIKMYVNFKHSQWCEMSDLFVYSGGYRNMLTMLFSRLPVLETVKTRLLKSGENIPGPDGIGFLRDAFKDLSFYRPGLPMNRILYSEWQYDVLHKCITSMEDAMGEKYLWYNAGPQSDCIEDAKAALARSGSRAVVIKTARHIFTNMKKKKSNIVGFHDTDNNTIRTAAIEVPYSEIDDDIDDDDNAPVLDVADSEMIDADDNTD